jgi:hypothetical protein
VPGSTLKLFVSHSSEDRELVELLVDLLRKALGLSREHIRCTSLPGYGLRAGASIAEIIRTEVEEAEVLVALISEASLDSLYMAFELGARWHTGKPLIPLLAPGLDSSRVPEPLRGIHAIQCTGKPQISQLVKDVGKELGLGERKRRSAYSREIEAIQQYSKTRPTPQWYGFEFTAPEEGAVVTKRQIVVEGRFEHKPPDGALHIFHASVDFNRWWPFVGQAAELALKDDGSWSATVEFEKGHRHYESWVVLALVSKSGIDLVEYFQRLPHHLSMLYRGGRHELEKHDEFNSMFGGIKPKSIQVCARRKLRIEI